MKSSKESFKEDKLREEGRTFARGMNDVKVEQERNKVKAVKRQATMLENAAEKELFG